MEVWGLVVSSMCRAECSIQGFIEYEENYLEWCKKLLSNKFKKIGMDFDG